MTDVIMARIEAINNGELPEGYKRTKAGIMPEDWDGAIRAKQLFKSHTDKKHNGDLEILASTQERGIVPRSQIGIDIQCSDEGVKGYKKVSKGDFVISLRSFQGGIEYSEYDGIVSPAYTILKPINDISAGFYRNYFKTDSFIDRLNGAVYGIRDGKQIGYEDFGDMYVHCPPLAEQKRIAEILLQCDKVIQLKQRKIKELGHLKKACLRMMFPAKGHSEPDIRFPEFSGDWEQRKLGEYVSITSGEAPSKFEEGTELYVKVDDLNYNDKYVVDTQNKVAEHSTVKRVTKGSVVFPKRGAAIITNKVRILGIDSYMDTNMMALTSERLDSEFLYNIISKEGLYKIADTSTIPQINNKHIEPYEVKIPSLDEQRRIGVYFKQLDHLITLHQRELEETKKKKKSLAKLLLTGSVRVPT